MIIWEYELCRRNILIKKLIETIKLLLPALIPSWNFFDVIAPSPRIQFSLFKLKKTIGSEWENFRPQPQHVSLLDMFKRLFWNAEWNESLYMLSCAERLAQKISEETSLHCEKETVRRINNNLQEKDATHIQIRLIFVKRINNEISEEVIYTTDILPLSDEVA